MYIASLSYQKDEGNRLLIEDVPLRRLIREHVGETLFHWQNCIDYEWAYAVRWGPKDPEFGIADRSLGHLLYNFGQWLANGFGPYKPAKVIASFDVSPEWVREHMPGMGWPWDGSDPEDCEESSQ